MTVTTLQPEIFLETPFSLSSPAGSLDQRSVCQGPRLGRPQLGPHPPLMLCHCSAEGLPSCVYHTLE